MRFDGTRSLCSLCSLCHASMLLAGIQRTLRLSPKLTSLPQLGKACRLSQKLTYLRQLGGQAVCFQTVRHMDVPYDRRKRLRLKANSLSPKLPQISQFLPLQLIKSLRLTTSLRLIKTLLFFLPLLLIKLLNSFLSFFFLLFAFIFLFVLFPGVAFCQNNILNIYVWSGEIPDSVIRKFEKETGIKVNTSTYDNNEILYAKLRTAKNAGYDLVIPTGYFVDRMRKQNMLELLDKSKLPNFKNLHPEFLNPSYDPGNSYAVPFLWGVTGIFYNSDYFPPDSIHTWKDLWDPRFKNQLMLLDDVRENFSIALMVLGYSPNDTNPDHIHQAFLKLKELMANVKVFSSDTVASIIIDDDATVGTAWNGDVFKASQENHSVKFMLPKEGFLIWVDNLAIPKNAPHKDNAYALINFILKPEISKEIALISHFGTVNREGKNLLPAEIRNNPIAYPPDDILKHGQFQQDLGEATLALYEKYWEDLKMGG